MSRNFNFSFSGDDIDNDFNGADFNVRNGEPPERTPSTALLIEPQLHTLEELASKLKLLFYQTRALRSMSDHALVF